MTWEPRLRPRLPCPHSGTKRRTGRVRRIGSAAAAVVLAISGAALVAIGIGPRTGAYRTLTVLSGSMDPAIPAGSVVVVTPIRPHDVRIGDVVTYQIPVEDHRVVTHRVISIEHPGAHPVLSTKGDANDAPDPWLARVADDRVWRVRFVVPVAGRLITMLRSRPAHIATVLVIPAVLALIWLAEIWRRPRCPVRPAHA